MAEKNMTPEKKGIPVAIKGVIAAGVLATAAAGAAFSDAFNRGEQPQPVETPTPSAAAASPTPKETATPAVKPTETTKPTEAPKVPCVILPTELCNQADLIHWKSPTGQDVTLIGFKDLPEGTQIFAPIDGQLAKSNIAQPSPFKGFYGNMIDSNDSNVVSYNLWGDIQFSNMNTEKVTAGSSIGKVTRTGITSLNGYDLIIEIDRLDPNQKKFVSAEDILKTLFPIAFTKAPINESSEGDPSTITIVIQPTSSPRP